MNLLPPLRLHIEATDRCGLRCGHCFKRPGQHDVPLDLVRALLADAKKLNVTLVSFGGGEPTLHPNFATMVREACEAGYTVSFVTNGVGFASTWEWVRAMPTGPGGIGAVAVSLDGPDAATHDSIRAPGAFDAAVKALALCDMAQIPAIAKVCVNTRNIDRLEQIARLASGLGCDAIEFAGMVPTRAGVESGLQPSPADLAAASRTLDELAGIFRAAVERDITLGHEVFTVGCDPFRAMGFAVDARGRLSLCCMLSALEGAGDDDSDVIADLASTRLVDAVPGLLAKAQAALTARLALLARRDPRPVELYPCALCAAYFGKLDWLADYPESPWAELLNAFRDS